MGQSNHLGVGSFPATEKGLCYVRPLVRAGRALYQQLPSQLDIAAGWSTLVVGMEDDKSVNSPCLTDALDVWQKRSGPWTATLRNI